MSIVILSLTLFGAFYVSCSLLNSLTLTLYMYNCTIFNTFFPHQILPEHCSYVRKFSPLSISLCILIWCNCVLHCCVRNFYQTPAGYTADRKTRRKRDVGCYGLLSATSHRLPHLPHLPPSPHWASVAPPAAMSGLEGRGEPPPPPFPPIGFGIDFCNLAKSRGWPPLLRLWVW